MVLNDDKICQCEETLDELGLDNTFFQHIRVFQTHLCTDEQKAEAKIEDAGKISNFDCKNDGNCEIFKKMKNDYEFNETNLKHCEEFLHPKTRITPCRYGSDCKAFQRLIDGSCRIDDLCHMKIFIHPVRNRSREDQIPEQWNVFEKLDCLYEGDCLTRKHLRLEPDGTGT